MVDAIFKRMVELATEGMAGAVNGMLDVIGCDLTLFETNFPIVTTLYAILQGFAIGLIFLTIIWQAFKTFGLPLGVEVENPILVVVKGAIAMFFVFFAKDIIIGYVFPLFQPTYEALSGGTVQQNTTAYTEALGKFNVAEIAAYAVSLQGMVLLQFIVVGICYLAVLFNFAKLLLEVVERYILVGVLTYTSPLAIAMVPARSTSNIFRSWMSMFMGQMTMLLINVWSIKMFFSIMGSGLIQDKFFLWLFLTLGFLKVAQRMDSYMQQVGVNVGTTGNALGGAILGFAASALTQPAIRGVTNGISKGLGGGFGGFGGFGGKAGAFSAGAAAMSAVSKDGTVTPLGGSAKAKGGVKDFFKSAATSTWTTPGLAMAAGRGATSAFQSAKGFTSSIKNPSASDMIKKSKVETGSAAEGYFKEAFNGGENVPNYGSLSNVSVGNGQATVTSTTSAFKEDESGAMREKKTVDTIQFSRTDMYNQPAGQKGRDWSLCSDNSGRQYYMTKTQRDNISGKPVMVNPATRK